MIYGSVCSGIEAATAAWHPLGWKAAWLSEIEKFPSAILQRHYPDIPNLGDMTAIHEKQEFKNGAIDLLVGGTPCQSFSVAGLRRGMADPRGNLALVFLRIADLARPRWIVWENVPGVLSSNRGRDFGAFLGALGELGYGWSYRIMDAQYFGVPQRRRRVFVVGHLGDWRRAAAVLFEPDGLRRNPPPSRKEGQGFTRDVGRSLKACGNSKWAKDQETLVAHTLRGEGYNAGEDGSGRGIPLVPALLTMRCGKEGGGKGPLVSEDKSLSLATGKNQVLFAPIAIQERAVSENPDSGPGGKGRSSVCGGYWIRRVTVPSRVPDTTSASVTRGFPSCAIVGVAI